mmetsp:Transcript_7920/g.31780  ORF Transcript_7920/g.31780 Transcript_7920/m.31780 type:complete len:217 (+) Transcript_7920:2189-2839(+)
MFTSAARRLSSNTRVFSNSRSRVSSAAINVARARVADASRLPFFSLIFVKCSPISERARFVDLSSQSATVCASFFTTSVALCAAARASPSLARATVTITSHGINVAVFTRGGVDTTAPSSSPPSPPLDPARGSSCSPSPFARASASASRVAASASITSSRSRSSSTRAAASLLSITRAAANRVSTPIDRNQCASSSCSTTGTELVKLPRRSCVGIP